MCSPFLCIPVGQLKLERLAEGGDELHNFARNAAYYQMYVLYVHVVGPCHHGMAHPQVADRGTASDKEGSCE